MPSCSVANCKNKHENGVRLFRFPSAPERARLWFERCGLAGTGWQPKPSSRLCEEHFDSSQFEEHRQDGWRKLKPNAVPTLFSTEADGCGMGQSSAEQPRTADECGTAEDVFGQTARWATNLKTQEQELLCNVVLDLQVSGEQGVNDVYADNLSAATQSLHVPENIDSCRDAHPICSDSIQDMNKAFHDSDIILNTESLVADSPSDEPLHSSSQQLLQQAVYRCPLCAHLTASLKQLVNHLMRHPLQNDPQSQSGHYPCTVCGKEFSCTAVLASHIRVIHQGMKSVKSRNNSKSSSSTGNSQRDLLCAICGRQFTRIGAFHRHSLSHQSAGDCRYLCSVCGLRAATATALRRHSAVHVAADRRPLACAHCDRRFVRAGDLRKHVRVHTGDRPYQCSVCGRSFSRTYSLLAHGRTHAAKSAMLPCVNCLKTFRSAAGLAAHHRFCIS